MANAVPKLNRFNYTSWSYMTKVLLESEDLWDIVSSEQRPPEDDSDNFKAWKTKNAKALLAILCSCEERVLDEIRDITTANEAWTALGKDFYALHKRREAQGIPPREAPGIDTPSTSTAPGIDTPSTSTINVSLPDDENADYNYKHYLANALSLGRVDDALGLCGSNPYLLKERLPNSRRAPVLHELIMVGGLYWEKKVAGFLETDQFPREALDMKNSSGDTPLSIAAQVGAINIAEVIVGIKPSLLFEPNYDGLIPVIVAICSHNFQDMFDFLYSKTLEVLGPLENRRTYCVTLITKSLELRKLDMALRFLREFPNWVSCKDNNGISPVYAAACCPPSLFYGKRRRSSPFWIRLSQLVSINREPNITSSEYSCAADILMIMETNIGSSDGLVYDAFFEAIRRGNFNFVVMLMKANIHISGELDDMSRNIYMCAIQYRQAEIFSLIFWEKDDQQVKLSTTLCHDKRDNNLLHMAATLAPPSAFDGISGPALHLQRELRWFKEVEKLVPPSALTSKNSDGMTPRELFTKNHKELVVAGEKWMKDTAYSCTIIAPLVITIMFAAAFQVPGGNNQDTGFPIFLNKWLFKLYMVSVATSLFSATTSVLVFLKILTSNYGEEDFFTSLPRKMIIGLSTLFLSLASMIIAFCSGLFLTLDGELGILIPIVTLAAFPVGYFVRSQFPLLVEIFISTYWQTIIFDRKIGMQYTSESE